MEPLLPPATGGHIPQSSQSHSAAAAAAPQQGLCSPYRGLKHPASAASSRKYLFI